MILMVLIIQLKILSKKISKLVVCILPSTVTSFTDGKKAIGPLSYSMALIVKITYGGSCIGVSNNIFVETGSQQVID